MRILFVGDMNPSANSFRVARALKELGNEVACLSTEPFGRRPGLVGESGLWTKLRSKIGYPTDETNVNERLLKEAETFQPNLVLLFKAMAVRPSTLSSVHERTNATVAFASFDNMEKAHNRNELFGECISHFDVVFMARGYDAEFYYRHGADRVVEFDLGYDKQFMYARESARPFKYDVTFIGSHEADREEKMKTVAEAGLDVHVWGNGWEESNAIDTFQVKGRPVYEAAYVDTMHDSKVVLNFYRKMNDDVMNSRVFEIPASGSFMLSERTDPAFEFFEDATEAAYFESGDDLREKVQYYLDHGEERQSIARRGRRRCVESGYDYHSRLESMLSEL